MTAWVRRKTRGVLGGSVRLFRQRACRVFALCARTTLAVILLAASCEPSRTQETNSSLLSLRFGETTIALEAGAVAWVSGHGKPDRSSGSTIDLAKNASAFFTPPFAIPACVEIGQVLLTYQTIKPIVRQQLFLNYTPASTEFRGVSQLKPPSGRPALDLYQFDANDLKDYWGEQITFYREPPMTRLNIQLTRDTQMSVAATADRCFFDRGEATIRQLMLFVSSKIKK